jgi:ankyrin repeat protein
MAYRLMPAFSGTAVRANRKGLLVALMLLFAGSMLPGCAQDQREIHRALRHHQLDRARAILKKNPKLVNAKGSQDWTPLHEAIQRFDYNTDVVFDFLIANGANVNAKDKWGWTPLHMAVKHDRNKKVEVLIANGAELNPKERRGRTPLDIALLYNRQDLAELLRKHGAVEGSRR